MHHSADDTRDTAGDTAPPVGGAHVAAEAGLHDPPGDQTVTAASDTPIVTEDSLNSQALVVVEAGADEELRLPRVELRDEAAAAEHVDGPVVASTADDGTASADVNLPLLEALLFATRHPLTAGRLGELLGVETTASVRRAVKQLNEQYADTARAFRVEQVAGGFQILTLPDFGETLKKLHQREADAKLTKAALETLAVIAYKQPILRAEIEAIRGVGCGETVRSLMEKHLVRIAGRAEEPGRPILYGTTRRFLETFGLAHIKDLPKSEDQPLKPTVE